MSLFIVKEITQLLSLWSVIDDRKYVTTILRTVENEVTILKHVWNFNVYVTAGLGDSSIQKANFYSLFHNKTCLILQFYVMPNFSKKEHCNSNLRTKSS